MTLPRCLAVLLVAISQLASVTAEVVPPIVRVLPPEGLEIPADVGSRLASRLETTKKRLEALRDDDLKVDAEIFTKAVELALAHREFYVEKDFAKAETALNQANERLDAIAAGQSPWKQATGTLVRGYRSSIDGSVQPYGLVIPKDHDLGKPCPLYIWLHGRGDKNTDLHFLAERSTRPGQIAPSGAIVVHPFGRHCVGWKHAGEIDVLEVVESVKERYQIDPARVVLIGFSMGGAGVWHMGAHYTDHWLAVSPGAGFVETARYQRLTPDQYPASYEQTLWGLYDVPGYTRNLFNTRVIAYSGELDKQIQAARIMEEAFQAEGRTLEHLIGPGVEHKYEPKTLEELMSRLKTVVEQADKRDLEQPSEVHLQTRTLRYNRQKWVAVDGLEEHWKDSRVDATGNSETISLKTKNVNSIKLTVPDPWRTAEVVIDDQKLSRHPFMRALGEPIVARKSLQTELWQLSLAKEKDGWKWSSPGTEFRKRPGLQGPIDDAFMSKFVVVVPTGKSKNPAFQAWCEAELKHFEDRWRALMRGDLPMVKDADFRGNALTTNLILWGDPDSNAVMKNLLRKLPVQFSDGKWSLGKSAFDGNRYVPSLVYPRTDDNGRLGGYVVLNSGLTFREGHDRTNSLQNPPLRSARFSRSFTGARPHFGQRGYSDFCIWLLR